MALSPLDLASENVRGRIFGCMLGSALGDCVGLFTGMVISPPHGASKRDLK